MHRAALLLPLALCACPGPRLVRPAIGDGGFTLTAEPDGGAVQLLAPDGGVLLTFPPDAVQLGTVPALDDSLSYDPYWLEEKDAVFSPVSPKGLRWRSATSAAPTFSGADTLTVRYDYGEGHSAVLTLKAETAGHFSARVTPTVPDGSATAFVRLRPRASRDEGFYGLGEWFDSVNHRGKRRPMQIEPDFTVESTDTENHVVVPFLVGTRGWGLFVESSRPGLFDVAKKEADLVEITFGTAGDSAAGLTFHLFAAAQPLDVPGLYEQVTGPPALPAPWALGPWVWRDENTDQAQVLDDFAQLRERDLASSGYWIDRPYATKVNTFDFEAARFPDPAALFTAAQAAGLKLALWHTPYLEPGSDPFLAEATAQGFFPPVVGTVLNKWSAPLDLTRPEARHWWQQQLGAYRALGVEGFKLDYGEDVAVGLSGGRNVWRFADGSDERTMHRGYTLLYHQTYAELFSPESSFLLCRTGRWGDQVHATVIWPGDIDATLTRFSETFTAGTDTVTGVGGLPAAVIAGQSLGVSGFPFFAADTGGYRHSPPSKETWVRWVEQSALGTAMQTGDGSSQMPWEYTPDNGRDDEALQVYRDFARLHLRLFPYLWTYAKRLASDGRPIQRPLGLAYPQLGAHPDDEYLLGDELLVAPVVTAGATSREVLLPPGRWLGFFDGVWRDGGAAGASVTVDAPLTKLPLFLRAGALLPLLRPSIDTLAPATDPQVESFADDAGLLYVRVVPGPSESISLYDGTQLSHAGGEVGVTPGAVFAQGAMLELLATAAPAEVDLDGTALPQVALASLAAADRGYAWQPDGGGTLWVRLPAGPHRIAVK